MRPTCTNVHSRHDVMGFPEELVPSPFDHPFQTKNVQKRDECHSDYAPHNVGLVDELSIKRGLRLVQLSFKDGQTESMEK